ncbi:MAG: TolC family outer membrane protein [Alphaproteobacteria bacterium]
MASAINTPWPGFVRLGGCAALALYLVFQTPAASAQSLTEALTRAYSDNPSLRAARAELRSVDETVAQALSGWRPTLSAQGDYGRTRAKTQSGLAGLAVGDREYRNPRRASVSIDQPLFRGGQTVAETKRAKNNVFAQRAALTDTEQTILLDSVRAYADVFRDQAVLDLAINNEQVLRRQLEATQDRFRVGEVTRTDVSQAEARYRGTVANRIRSEGQLDITRAAYQNVIGAVPGDLDRPPMPGNLPDSKEAVVGAAVKNQPALRRALFAHRAAEAEVSVAVGGLMPQVSLNGSISDNEETFSRDSGSNDWTGTVQVQVPLYQAGAQTASVRERRQRVSQRALQVSEAQRNAVESATAAWEALKTARAQISSFESQIKANELALEGVQQEALVGSRTVLDILDAEQELLDSRVSLVTAQRDEVVAAYQVKAAMGQLTAADLGLPVDIYDVEEHYDEARNTFWGLGRGEED